MFHPHSYKLDLAGRLRVWQVEQNGSHSYLHNVLFGERPDYCTVQFFGWSTTDNPKPRHPIGKQLHWGERDS